MKNEKYILYIGGYLDEKIVQKRGLPTRNPAGSNRMERIANAMNMVGQKTIIVSPGISLRTKFTDKIIHSADVRRSKKTPVIFAPTIGLPIFGVLSIFFLLPLMLIRLRKKRKISTVVIYNFSPLLVLTAFMYRYVFRVPVFQNIEDVSIPKLNDWSKESETRPLQQIVFYICMNLISFMAKGFIIPTRQFLSYLDKSKPYKVVTGCIDVKPSNLLKKKEQYGDTIHILFSGKIEFEHGIDKLIGAMQLIDENKLCENITVDICGGGSKAQWLEDELKSINNINITYHGFVDDVDYIQLLDESDICVALQDPSGRHSTTKTPSKVYEYLGYYKTVIATDVGDLAELPTEIIAICTPFNETVLSQLLTNYIEDKELIEEQAKKAGDYAFEHYSYTKVGDILTQFIRDKNEKI